MLQRFLLLVLIQRISADVYCDDLGWFYPIGPFFDWPDPECPDDQSVDLLFWMYAGIADVANEFDEHEVPLNFEPNDDTIFIVHGQLQNNDDGWMHDLKNVLRNNNWNIGGKNIALVKWHGSGGSNAAYEIAASTTRTIGAKLALVMMNLVNRGGGDRTRMHCVGHGLGAHVCGHAGRWIEGIEGYLPGRITGLDPAGPVFDTNPDRSVGLYVDCAEFVDVIHTDPTIGSTPVLGGVPIELGHQDFYPNDGTNQPGCGSDICNHFRAIELFSASVTNECFMATETCSMSNNLPGSCIPCGSNCARMGYFASGITSLNGLYRLDTGNGGNFC